MGVERTNGQISQDFGKGEYGKFWGVEKQLQLAQACRKLKWWRGLCERRRRRHVPSKFHPNVGLFFGPSAEMKVSAQGWPMPENNLRRCSFFLSRATGFERTACVCRVNVI